MINDIKKEIVRILSENVDKVQHLTDYNALDFEGFPAISVTLSENENDFATTSEDVRVFGFKVRCFVLASNKGQPVNDEKTQRAERVMGNLVDQVIDTLDKNTTLDNTVEFTEPAPSSWFWITNQAGDTLMAEVILRVHKYKTVI